MNVSQCFASSVQLNDFREMVDFCAENYADNPAFSFRRGKDSVKTVSYVRFRRDVSKLCAAFADMGLAGKHIAVVGENSYEWILTYFASVCLGGTIVPLDKELSASELSCLIQRSRCAAVVFSKSYSSKIQSALDGISGIDAIPAAEIMSLAEETEDGGAYASAKVTADMTAAIVFTSGTTGDSKGVVLSHRNLVSNALSAADAVQPYKKCLLILPAHHTFGLVASIFTPMIKGCEVYISSGVRRLTRDIAFFKPQVLVVVPVMAETIYKKLWVSAENDGQAEKMCRGLKISRFLRRFGIDVRRKLFKPVIDSLGGELEGIVCGGASVDSECAAGFTNMGIEFLAGYGITECSPVVCVNRVKTNCIGSVGSALACNEIRITNTDENGVGDVEVRGTNVMRGYLDDEKATRQAFDGEWFKTGDLGRLDKKGNLFLAGRKKNLIILSNGKNVSPEELENRLLRSECIGEVVVYESGGKITAEIFPDKEYTAQDAEEEINRAVNELNKTVPAYKNIEKVIIRATEFPKTTTMKIKRKYEKKTEGEDAYA